MGVGRVRRWWATHPRAVPLAAPSTPAITPRRRGSGGWRRRS